MESHYTFERGIRDIPIHLPIYDTNLSDLTDND